MTRMRALARVLGIMAAVIALAACGTARGAVPIVNPIDASAMPPCNEAPLAFNGTTSLAALGLTDQVGGGPEANKPGHVWITADPIVPEGWGVGKGAPPPEPMRFVCVEWEDGSGMAGNIALDWQPPSGVVVAEADAGPPLGTIGVLGLVVVGIVISVIAFRRP
jgi:hypothetical protein